MSEYEGVIGLEVHAEMLTQSKMFCGCAVLDVTTAQPNTAVCPVCAGMPGVLPVINRSAVEYALRVALALECEVYPRSIFARKNYFYPDLPKGYQISQYEEPLARNGKLTIHTSQGTRVIRVRRVHLEEDTGKLTHVEKEDGDYSLVDLNRAGVPLLEIVSEPDLHTAEEVRAYAVALREVLRYLGVNSGEMQKGVIRIEPNISVRLAGSQEFGTRVEVKNLNSFRVLERSVAYEIERQSNLLRNGGKVIQQTLGWDEQSGTTFAQRSKEEAHDYRYFPEPDLPPLILEPAFIEQVRASLPELPEARRKRFISDYELNEYDAGVLIAEKPVADYFEDVVRAAPETAPKTCANWITGTLFSMMNQSGQTIDQQPVTALEMAALLRLVAEGAVNQNTAKGVLSEMFTSGERATAIIERKGLRQVSGEEHIRAWVAEVIAGNPAQVSEYLGGKETLLNWLFGQAMRQAGGRANPALLRAELARQLEQLR